MTKLEKVAISHNFNFRGWWFFVPVQEQFADNTNKSYDIRVRKRNKQPTTVLYDMMVILSTSFGHTMTFFKTINS